MTTSNKVISKSIMAQIHEYLKKHFTVYLRTKIQSFILSQHPHSHKSLIYMYIYRYISLPNDDNLTDRSVVNINKSTVLKFHVCWFGMFSSRTVSGRLKETRSLEVLLKCVHGDVFIILQRHKTVTSRC